MLKKNNERKRVTQERERERNVFCRGEKRKEMNMEKKNQFFF